MVSSSESSLVPPADIDGAFVPHRRGDVSEVVIDEEMLLVGGGNPLLLNATGTLVWQCLDGEVSLDELIDELVDVLGVDAVAVRSDVLDFVRSLGTTGLLDGVGIVIDPSEFEFAEPTVPLGVGDAFPPFALPDLDGSTRSLEEWRGRSVLIVNWSPGCGYCTVIAPQLGELQPHLAAKGVDVLFVSSGDADSNRPILAGAEIDAPMLLKGDEPDPFAGFGTPMAYLLDEEGTVATGVGWGADQVLALVQETAGVVLDHDPLAPEVPVDDPARTETGAGGGEAPSQYLYLPAPGGMCGPGAGAGGPATDWVGTVALELDEYHVGIKHNGEYTLAMLDRVFPGQRVADRRVPDNYSLALHDADDTGRRELHLLVRGGQSLVRSRSVERVLRGLLAYLDADLHATDPSLVHVHLGAVVRGGRAYFAPGEVITQREHAQPRLHRAGFQVPDVPFLLLDPATNELVIPEPQVVYDREALAGLDADARLGRELACVTPGRYPVQGWVLHTHEDVAGELTHARAVASLLPFVARRDGDVRSAVDELVSLVDGVPVIGVHFETTQELVKQLAAVL